jgi:acetylglutamate kinase
LETTVIKIGGASLGGGADPVVAAAARHARRGGRTLVVHGGGSEITAWCRRLGIESRFRDGLRVTDADTADVVEMVLAGRVGRALAAAFTAAGVPAVSLSGKDAGLFAVEPLDPGLGQVGHLGRVEAGVLAALWGAGLLPVVAPVGPGPGGRTFNVNADDAAADLAAALGAATLLLVSDVPGVLVDGRLLPRCSPAQAEELIAAGVVTAGMVPKVRACLRAVAAGVGRAVITDGAGLGGDEVRGTTFAA